MRVPWLVGDLETAHGAVGMVREAAARESRESRPHAVHIGIVYDERAIEPRSGSGAGATTRVRDGAPCAIAGGRIEWLTFADGARSGDARTASLALLPGADDASDVSVRFVAARVADGDAADVRDARVSVVGSVVVPLEPAAGVVRLHRTLEVAAQWTDLRLFGTVHDRALGRSYVFAFDIDSALLAPSSSAPSSSPPSSSPAPASSAAPLPSATTAPPPPPPPLAPSATAAPSAPPPPPPPPLAPSWSASMLRAIVDRFCRACERMRFVGAFVAVMAVVALLFPELLHKPRVASTAPPPPPPPPWTRVVTDTAAVVAALGACACIGCVARNW
jgi:hypothetical protein